MLLWYIPDDNNACFLFPQHVVRFNSNYFVGFFRQTVASHFYILWEFKKFGHINISCGLINFLLLLKNELQFLRANRVGIQLSIIYKYKKFYVKFVGYIGICAKKPVEKKLDFSA